MNKPKKNRKYEFEGYLFNTFNELKTYVYYHTSTNEDITGYELENDVITKKYIFHKKERRLIYKKTYDKDEEDLKKWNQNQLKLF